MSNLKYSIFAFIFLQLPQIFLGQELDILWRRIYVITLNMNIIAMD